MKKTLDVASDTTYHNTSQYITHQIIWIHQVTFVYCGIIKMKVMRNKQIIQNRLGRLNGLIQKQDMNVNRGGNREQYNETHREIKEVLQDIMDIVERES